MPRLHHLSALILQVELLGREQERLLKVWDRRGGTQAEQDVLWKLHEDAHRDWREKSAELKREKAEKS